MIALCNLGEGHERVFIHHRQGLGCTCDPFCGEQQSADGHTQKERPLKQTGFAVAREEQDTQRRQKQKKEEDKIVGCARMTASRLAGSQRMMGVESAGNAGNSNNPAMLVFFMKVSILCISV